MAQFPVQPLIKIMNRLNNRFCQEYLTIKPVLNVSQINAAELLVPEPLIGPLRLSGIVVVTALGWIHAVGWWDPI